MKVLVTDRNLQPYQQLLAQHGPTGTTWSFADPSDGPAVLEELADADVLVGASFTPAMAEAAPRLRLVHVAGAGTDGVDRDALGSHVALANTFHHGRSIAEYVVMSLVFLGRRIGEADSALRRGSWRSPVYDPAQPQPSTLRGSTVGFLGFGSIGSETWRVLHGFDVDGVALVRRPDRVLPDDRLDVLHGPGALEELLARVDHLVVSVPLTAQTQGMLGAAELGRMRRTALLVNVARGPVVQEQALFDALQSGAIAGAAIDVWYSYPAEGSLALPSRLPFAALPNVLMTPHLSGVTAETFRRRALDICDNLHRLAEGRALERLVVPGRPAAAQAAPATAQ
ncbi:Formate dehydrogenase, mitochondrial [Cellulomonas sp. T2.31MG-18]|uniref:2-hydroxyacid dehydrogenase n=1 Tax=Cellulomonas sp. T2.31MG-18 TaxID=3157619 RepID=UPI0035EF22F6